MLQQFLVANRQILIDRCRTKVATRRAPRATPTELEYGIPLFLTQLTDMLSERKAYAKDGADDEFISPGDTGLMSGATKHGEELLRHGFTIDQVVHDYGDLCQSITRLAAEKNAPITLHEFGLMNIKLDNAIAGSVTEYTRARARITANESAITDKAGLAMLAHEMRNFLNTSILAISAIKGGTVGFTGATAAALDRSLIGMRDLIDRALAEVRLGEANPIKETIEIAPFILEIQVGAALEAATKGCELTVAPVARGIFVEADAHMLAASVTNLLQNAFKFTRAHSHVLLSARSSKGRVLIEVEDQCGGLPGGTTEGLFRPFQQFGQDRSGVGLGLPISRKAIEASGGTLSVKNKPGQGCVFTIDMPQKQVETDCGEPRAVKHAEDAVGPL
jgi:signal transduction histidine kinase